MRGLLLSLLCFNATAGEVVIFAGVGYEHGSVNYEDDTGAQFRDKYQGVFGINYETEHFIAQYYHSSGLDNYQKSSWGDTNQVNLLLVHRFK